MQTPKGRSSSSEGPQRTSPGTPKAARRLRAAGSESDSTSTNSVTRTTSSKLNERVSPRSPASEKKRPGRVSELESQLAQLQEDLKKMKDQLTTSETWKKHAHQEAEEAKRQLLDMSKKLEESQQQFLELSASEDSRVQELCKVSQDRDRAWQSELEAVQKQHSVDSATLSSAMNEIHRLRFQLEIVAQSEDAQTKQVEAKESELQRLKIDLQETLSVVANMNVQLKDSKESEAQAQALVTETLQQLETAKTTVEMLQSDALKDKEAYNNLILKLEQSRAQVSSLEELVNKLQVDLVQVSSSQTGDSSVDERCGGETRDLSDSKELRLELDSVNLEMGQLKAALEAAEARYQEEHIQYMLQIQSAYVMVEQTKSEGCLSVSELEAELKKTKDHVEELKGNLMEKETTLHRISQENEGLITMIKQNMCSQEKDELEVELQKLKADVTHLKENLMDKEIELRNMSKEKELLELEIKKREMEGCKATDEAIAEAEAARAAEREALTKVSYVTEEADKSSKRAVRVTEQLEAAQAANSEMEVELRRLKVQLDQWRKAAEAAAAFFSTGNNGKLMDDYITGKIGSPNSEDMDDDDSPKRKNNMLKKIGVLWKKGQK